MQKWAWALGRDAQFVKYHWEVASPETSKAGIGVASAKGGDFSRYYSDIDVVVDWQQ